MPATYVKNPPESRSPLHQQGSRCSASSSQDARRDELRSKPRHPARLLKNRVTDETLQLLLQLGGRCGLRARIDAMFKGERSTSRKNAPSTPPCVREGCHHPGRCKNVVPEVRRPDKMAAFCDRVARGMEGAYRQASAPSSTSHRRLRPARHGLEALKFYSDRALTFRFVSTSMAPISPRPRARSEETLVIVSSKTFTTLETLTNAPLALVAGEAERRKAVAALRGRLPTPKEVVSSASTRPTCSNSGTGSAAMFHDSPSVFR